MLGQLLRRQPLNGLDLKDPKVLLMLAAAAAAGYWAWKKGYKTAAIGLALKFVPSPR